MPFEATWMDLERVRLGEVSQTEEKYMISLIHGIEKEMIQINLQRRRRLVDLENELMAPVWRR